ncbi:bifunctional hydroxymethylpyrimidine kinase/phosphomethylpyrimidine kinase [bacterium]|nr:bifunctional hydroxymethylpyrimidine kinase/phosphomethylpyrimidine kinase [bacterium]
MHNDVPDNRHPVALTIAGSDSGAGAGIQADLKTFAAHGIYGCSVITLVTAQSTQSVDAVELLPPELLVKQLETVVQDFKIGALKTGALGSAEIIRTLAGYLHEHPLNNLVVDPVMISKHGHALLADDAAESLTRDLLPLARIVTPNLQEASVLAGLGSISSRAEMIGAAAAIARSGCPIVVVKGGHNAGEPVDLFWEDGRESWLDSPRIDTPHTHGTGCTFSAAIAANLVRGLKPLDAVREAKAYISGAIEHHQLFGRGLNPVNHFWRLDPAFGSGQSLGQR